MLCYVIWRKSCMKIEKIDLIRELKSENIRCSQYRTHMYQVLQFTFLAIIALAVCGFSKDVTDDGFKVIFRLVLPICFYIFGIMYAFNAYVLANCGKREELLHSALFSNQEKVHSAEMILLDKDTSSLIIRNVIADRWVSMISYGVPLGFYLMLPLASVRIGFIMNKISSDLPHFLIEVLPICGLVIYYIIMIIIICKIFQSHFSINKIQNRNKDKVNNDILITP